MLVSWYSHPPKSLFIQAVLLKNMSNGHTRWQRLLTELPTSEIEFDVSKEIIFLSEWWSKEKSVETRDSSGPQESLCLRRHFVPCWRNNQRRHYVSRSTTQNSTLARDTRFHTSFSHQLTNIPLASGAFIQDLLKFMRMRETSRELFAPMVILCGA